MAPATARTAAVPFGQGETRSTGGHVCTIAGVERRRVLVVDDEPELRKMLRGYLQAEGFDVAEATDGDQALARLSSSPPDLIVLDVGLPGLDGFEVLRLVRSGSDVPVIMLTARAEEIDRVVGLTVGADDYVTKPFSPRELVARINAVLRRSRLDRSGSEELLEYEGLRINLDRREILRDGKLVTLSTLEFDLLAALASVPGRVFTRSQLLERVWGWDYFGEDRVIDVHIGNIRKALGDDASNPTIIGTVRGVGYKFLGKPR